MFSEGLPQLGVFRQNQNSFVIVAELQFPSGAHHALRQFPSNFAFLDDERLFALLYRHRRTQSRQCYFVACLKIVGTADNL